MPRCSGTGLRANQQVRVGDLIELLKQQDQDAVVVMWDHFGLEPGISKLGYGEVNPAQLCGHDNDGLFIIDLYAGQNCDSGAFPGVFLGSK